MSFREYLFLETGITYDRYVAFENGEMIPVKPSATILAVFAEYRKLGTRPFYSEGFFNERMLAVLDKSIHSDVPFLYLKSLKTSFV